MARLLWVSCVVLVGCDVGADPANKGLVSVSIEALDTLASSESGVIAYASDLQVAPSGDLHIADGQGNEILIMRSNMSEAVRLGRAGAGPGEFSSPRAIRATGQRVVVVDRGNGRIQHLGPGGEFVRSVPVTPMVASATPHLRADGSLLVGTRGRDSVLVAEFDSAGTRLRGIGEPVVDPPQVMSLSSVKARIGEGTVPAELRNDALVSGERHGPIWVALRAEGEVRRYSSDGRLEWTTPVEEPEMAATRALFFERNAADDNPTRFFTLRYFADVTVVDEEFWVLLTTQPGDPAVIVVFGSDGKRTKRLEVASAGGAGALAVDPMRRRLFLSTGHDAQILRAILP